MTVTTSGSCLWCQKVVCLVMLKNDLVHKWVFTSLPQIDSTVIYGSNSIVYQSISIPLLRGGCVKSNHQVFFDILYKKDFISLLC